MTAILRIDQSGVPGTNNQSREDIVAGIAVQLVNVSPGTSNAIALLWKPPEDDTSAITGDPAATSEIVPKTGTWGTWEVKLTVDGEVVIHTFDILSPELGLPEIAANEKSDPTANLTKNTATEIARSETNTPFGPFTSGSAFGWWYKIRRWLRKLDALMSGTTGHTHDGTAGNGPTITAGTPPHSATTGQTADDHHAHANKTQIDLVTDGDHDIRADNPHSTTAAQVGAYTTAQVDVLVDATLKPPEAFAPAGTYPVTYGGNAVQQGDTFRITGAGTMGAITVNVEDLLIALVDTPAQVDGNWMVAESNRDQATETVKGVAKIATQAEADAGTNDTNIMTALKAATAPVRAHDIDPGAGPHTGGLPEASSEFDDSTGHDHSATGSNGSPVNRGNAITPVLSPGTYHNLDPTGRTNADTVAIIFTGGDVTITGFDSSGPVKSICILHLGEDGRELTLPNLDAGSSAANQFVLGVATDLVMRRGDCANLVKLPGSGWNLIDLETGFQTGDFAWAVTTDSGAFSSFWHRMEVLANRIMGRGPTGGYVPMTAAVTQGILDTILAEQTLTDAATVIYDVSAGRNAKVTLGGNRILNITNTVAGQRGVVRIIQDGTPPRTLTYQRGGVAGDVDFAGGVAPTLTNAAAAVDVLEWYDDGAKLHLKAYSLDSK